MFVFCVMVALDRQFWRERYTSDYCFITLLMVGFFMLTPFTYAKVRTWATGEVGDHRIWSDVMCLRQCQKDFDLGRVSETIKAIGNTTMFLDPLPGSTSPALMTRIFCIFEIFSTMQYDIKLKAVVSPGGYFSTMPRDIERVSIAYAESRCQKEKDAIMDRIATWANQNKSDKSTRSRDSLQRRGVAHVNEMLVTYLRDAFVKAEARVLRRNVWLVFFIKTLALVLSLYLELREAGQLSWSGVVHLQHLTPRPLCVAVLEHNVESYHEFFMTKNEHVRGPLVSVTAICLYCACLVHCLVEIKTTKDTHSVLATCWGMWQRTVKAIFTSGTLMVFMLFHEACICTLYLCMHKTQCIKFRPIVFACNLLIFLFPHCCVYRGIRIMMVQLPPSIIPSQTSVLHIGRLIIRKRDLLIASLLDAVIMFNYWVMGADVLEGTAMFSFIVMLCFLFVIESTHVRSPPRPPLDHGRLEFGSGQVEHKSGSYGTCDGTS